MPPRRPTLRLTVSLIATLLLGLALASLGLAAAGPFAHLATIENPTPTGYDFFGYPIEALGTDMLVGAGQDDTLAANAGAVYLFDGDPTSPTFGTLLHTFTKPSAAEEDLFGFTIATRGSSVLIGSVRDDTVGPDAGAVFMFDGDRGSATFGELVRTFLNPTPAEGDYFGYSIVAVGGNVAVGDFLDGWTGPQAGGVYLFDGDTGALLFTFRPPGSGAGEHFGYDLAALGTRLVIGAPHGPRVGVGYGAVYVVDADPASPSFGSILSTIGNPSDGPDEFGSAVAMVGGNILVGASSDGALPEAAGAAYLFDGTTGALLKTLVNPHPTADGQFGYAVAVLGTQAIVTAQHDDTAGDNAGAVYVYDADPASPRFGELVRGLFPDASPLPADDNFGVAVAAVGTDIVVGAVSGGIAGVVHLFTPCGDGIVSAIENCEDGNVLDGDCCSSSCRYETSGEACDDGDGDVCTTDACTGSGVCVAQGAVPQSGCRAPTRSGKAQLRIDARPGGPSRVQWKWKSGAATPLTAFGDPLVTTDYTLCVYDESAAPQPVMQAVAPAGGDCAGSPCWSALRAKGFKYKSPDGSPAGLQSLQLAAGGDGKATIALKGGGSSLATPGLPLATKVTAQLKSATGACWESKHSVATRTGPNVFKAASD